MRFRLLRFWVLAALALALGPAASNGQQQSLEPGGEERRVALVIGNGNYGPSIGPLANPTNDASDIAQALREVGFQVTLELDVGRDRMRRAVIEFGRSLRGGGVGLFYYSGHAVQLGNSNYLIPLAAEVNSEDYVPVETVDLNEVLARMGGADNRLNIVILDACRNNPFKGLFRSPTRGLAQTIAPSGTFIAYAAAPGELALDGRSTRNSPYTSALLEAIREPGLRLEDVFKRVRREVLARTDHSQTPWTGSSLTGDFYFRLPEPVEAAPAPTPSPAPMEDVRVWRAIADSRNPEDFEFFLEAYPESPLVQLARRRLPALQPVESAASTPRAEAETPPAAVWDDDQRVETDVALSPEVTPIPEPLPGSAIVATPEEPALSRDDRRRVQLALNDLGHSAGMVDGLFGPRTRGALEAWQRSKGYPDTGYLDQEQTAFLVEHGQGVFVYQPGDEFRDCEVCPVMIVVPTGSFMMGSPKSEAGRDSDEGPQHLVTISEPFAVGKYEVTFAEWDACVADRECQRYRLDDKGWGRGRRPVINVSWDNAQAYVDWLKRRTGQSYRLLTEAEWEYVARAGTTTPFWTGARIGTDQANYDGNYYGSGRKGRYRGRTTPVDTFEANPWGLHDMHGNVWEWVEDCWNSGYEGAPKDGSAWLQGDCSLRVARGGSWNRAPGNLRSANRLWFESGLRGYFLGFRVSRTLTP